MTARRIGVVGKLIAAGAGIAMGAYAARVGATWACYGQVRPDETADELLNRFIPVFEVAERHTIRIAAPVDVAFAASCDMDLQQSRMVRAIFKGRELILGANPDATRRPEGLVAQTKSLGWGVLAEIPGREIVMGAVTQPWKANVVFRALPPADFAAFNEPGYAKIVWTLRADPVGDHESLARTETRVVTTDSDARVRFRRYWSLVSPGVVLIRYVGLRLVKADAEHRFSSAAGMTPALRAVTPNTRNSSQARQL